MDIEIILKKMAEMNASDLHIKAGRPPCIRKDGTLTVLDLPGFTSKDTEDIALQIIPDRLLDNFKSFKELDFAFGLSGVGRFRTNIFRERGFVGIAMRRVASKVPSMTELGLPGALKGLSEEKRGLVLVTGTAGSGKSTTLATMIDHINHTRNSHIITIEDPIEVIHNDDKSIINQREIGIDSDSYAEALRNVVRQDPDVILIGEMRDIVTVQAALSAAEMGTLVLSTIHTIDAAETINRIIDFFPPHQQEQIRLMLSSTIKGIVSQRLIPKIGGGLVPAIEVLVATGTVKELISENNISGLKEAIEDGDYYGMQSFEQHLIELFQEEQISLEDAVSMAHNAHDFKLKLRQMGLDDGRVDRDEPESLEGDNDQSPLASSAQVSSGYLNNE